MALLQWAYFVIGPFVAAWTTLFVWARSQSMAFAMTAGTLAGAVVLLLISALFWGGGGYTVAAGGAGQ